LGIQIFADEVVVKAKAFDDSLVMHERPALAP
jgi:hypothetical protein